MELKVDFKIGGISFVLTIVFVILKFTGVVSWSWFICFLPIIAGAALTIIILIIMFLIVFCTTHKKK